MKKVSTFAFGLLFVCSMLLASAAFANDGQNGQGQNNNDQGGGGKKGSSPSAPLDGGITLLLAAGVGLGVKKVLDQRKHLHA